MTHEGPAAGGTGAPDEHEMRAALEEQLRNLPVSDVLLQSTVTLINLGVRRLGLTGGGEERDPAQARLAIEGARALVGLLPPEEGAQLREPLSQLQLAYAREAQAGAGPPPGASAAEGPPTGGPPPAPGQAPGPGQSPEDARRRAQEEAERARARSKIWIPGSS
jgi:hypothetical protein